MKSVILTKKQLKRARYLANVNFGQGHYYRRDGSKDAKVRNYVDEDGYGVVWTEAPSGSNFAVTTEFVSKGYSECDGDLDELLTILGFDTDAKNALRTTDYTADHDDESKPHQDIEDAVAVAVEHLSQEAEPPQEAQPAEPEPQPEVHVDLAAKAPEVTIQGKIPASVAEIKLEVVAEAINPREKLRKCATMRLAKEYGMAPETELSTIVEKFGNDAVVRYQDLLKMTPSFGLTEADVRHVFPQEYASLPL